MFIIRVGELLPQDMITAAQLKPAGAAGKGLFASALL